MVLDLFNDFVSVCGEALVSDLMWFDIKGETDVDPADWDELDADRWTWTSGP